VEPAVDVDRPGGGLRVVQVPCATPHHTTRTTPPVRPSVTGHFAQSGHVVRG
jgi:hypothetical protein